MIPGATPFTRMPRPRGGDTAGHPAQWGYVANVYVVPSDRDRGTGRRLLDAVTAHADQRCFARLVLSPKLSVNGNHR